MKRDWAPLRKAVLARIRPTAAETERALAASRRLSEKARNVASKLGARVEPVLVGSLRKQTHLRPKPDIDVFLLFPPETARSDLEALGVRIGKRILRRPVLRYAEHPYVHGTFGAFVFDVVPAYKVTSASGRLSAVDRSPFHADYVRRHLRPGQRDEVRLLKQFLKGIGCYGAETATGGFSGYLAELLVLHAKSFSGVVETFSGPDPPLRLSLDKGDPRRLGGAFVFVDPVDAERNAAAAVTQDRLDAFLRACRAFRRRPTLEFFWPKPLRPLSATNLRERLEGQGVLVLEVPTPQVRPDAVAPHLRRLMDKLGRTLEDEGFGIKARRIEPLSARRHAVLLVHEPLLLPETYEHRGPRVEDTDHTRRFLQKWQNHPDAVALPHPVEGRWRVTVRRTERSGRGIVRPRLGELLKGTQFSPTQRRDSRIQEPTHLTRSVAGRRALTRLLDPRDPWEL